MSKSTNYRKQSSKDSFRFKRYDTVTNCIDTYLIVGFNPYMASYLEEYKVINKKGEVGYKIFGKDYHVTTLTQVNW